MFSKPITVNSAYEALYTKATTLFNETIKDKKEIPTDKAFSVAYTISMPLLASAQMQNNTQYAELLKMMLTALKNLESKTLTAWLWGRIYTAARAVGDTEQAEKAQAQLKTYLTDSSIKMDAFLAWGWGYYLANETNGEYKSHSSTMFKAASDINAIYAKEPTQDHSTDAMWSWVMAIQAAANNGDENLYKDIIKAMKEMTGQTTVDAALNKGLSEGDYPAWAKAIVYKAAEKMKDENLVKELSVVQAIQQAKTKGKLEEFMLADLTVSASLDNTAEKNHKVSR